jgi:tetratricopeptide (TPR) repeat protein
LPVADCRFKPRGLARIHFAFGTVFRHTSFAADPTADFSTANKLYAEGKFADAAAAYEKMLSKPACNRRRCCSTRATRNSKAGHLGRAIAAYRRAALRSPRDAELRANLAFVRNQVQGATHRESRWQNWTGALTLNEGRPDRGVVLADVGAVHCAANAARADSEAENATWIRASGRADDFFAVRAGVAGGESFYPAVRRGDRGGDDRAQRPV